MSVFLGTVNNVALREMHPTMKKLKRSESSYNFSLQYTGWVWLGKCLSS